MSKGINISAHAAYITQTYDRLNVVIERANRALEYFNAPGPTERAFREWINAYTSEDDVRSREIDKAAGDRAFRTWLESSLYHHAVSAARRSGLVDPERVIGKHPGLGAGYDSTHRSTRGITADQIRIQADEYRRRHGFPPRASFPSKENGSTDKDGHRSDADSDE